MSEKAQLLENNEKPKKKTEICKLSETRVAEVSRRSERSSRGKRTFEVRRRRCRVRKSFRAAVIKSETKYKRPFIKGVRVGSGDDPMGNAKVWLEDVADGEQDEIWLNLA